jgi:hypothetical protein
MNGTSWVDAFVLGITVVLLPWRRSWEQLWKKNKVRQYTTNDWKRLFLFVSTAKVTPEK